MGQITHPQLDIKIYSTTYEGTISLENQSAGSIIFNEKTHQIGINGKWFGLATQAQYDKLVSDVSALTTKVGDGDDTISEQIAAEITDALGTSFGEGEGKYADVSAAITALNGLITNAQSTANTAVTNAATAQQTAEAKVASVSVGNDENLIGVTGTTEVTVSSTTALQNAVSAANSAVQSVNGITGPTAVIGAKDIKVEHGVDGGVTGHFFNKTAADNDSILEAIQKLDEALNNITDGDLEDINAAITAIKNELINADGDDADLATTLIDKLSTFLGGATQWTVNSNNDVTDVADLITELKAYADSKVTAAQNAAATDATNKANTAESNANSYTDTKAAALLGTSGATGATIYGAKKDAADALAAAQAAQTAADKHSEVVGVTGATAGTSNYVMVTGATGASGQTIYTVQTTAALESALNNVSWVVDPS